MRIRNDMKTYASLSRTSRLLTRTCLFLLTGLCVATASAQSIAIVQATRSAPNEAERNYARSVSDRIERLLTSHGLDPKRITDDDVVKGGLKEHSLAILAYNPDLPPDEFKQVQSFVAKGGRLIVFYSADPDLAALMGVKLGTYASDARAQSWCAMRFTNPGVHHLPKRVRQRSRNIRPVAPLSAAGKVIAEWENIHGGLTGHAAWVETPRGFWMSHVLLDDGDTEAKAQMLIGLLGALDTSIWRRVAEHTKKAAMIRAGFATEIRRRANSSDRARTVLPVLDAAASARQRAISLHQKKAYADAVLAWKDYEQRLLMAYGAIHEPAPDLFRGVWEHQGTGPYPGDWIRTCASVADAGLTDILTNVSWPGKAHYASAVLPRSSTFALWGDQLEQALAAAHKYDLKLHVWKVCWRLDGAPEALLASMRKAERLQVTSAGKTINWLCPSDDRNLAYEKDAVREILRNYPVDGIHLDYIRYPDSGSCFCKGCRSRFEAKRGRRVANWPEDASHGGRDWRAYSAWRATQITRLVRDVNAIVDSLRPEASLSAAVYGKYPLCIASVGQDWGLWLKQGYVDFICPMNYTDDVDRFAGYTRPQLALPTQGGRVYPGIGVTANESRLDAIGTIKQIQRARALGARGFTLYELTPVLDREIFPTLKLGVTRTDK